MIRSATDRRWVRAALADLDAVLVDHAHCEKKAAATAMSLVTAYPSHDRLVRRLSALAIEELRHFRLVHAELRRRGLELGRDRGDGYARALKKLVRPGRGHLTDRLLVAGLIEARSRERLALLGEALADERLARLYRDLAEAEERHARLFVDLARAYDEPSAVDARLAVLAAREARIVASLPIGPRIH